jgi:hypothetical protein
MRNWKSYREPLRFEWEGKEEIVYITFSLLLSVALSFASPRFPFFVFPNWKKGVIEGGLYTIFFIDTPS